MKIKKTERGWAGHFICADSCRFRRNTLIQYGKKYIVVSTVGAMYHHDEKAIGTIGVDRYYETMAFYSDPSDKIYHDIQVDKQVYVSAKWAIGKSEMEDNKSNIDNIANQMHENYVRAIEKALTNHEL